MKFKYLYISLLMFLTVILISCTFAADNNTDLESYPEDNYQDRDYTSFTLNNNYPVNVNEDISITGKVTDNKGNGITDSDIFLSITRKGYGDEEYEDIISDVIKTDKEGKYTYSYKSEIGGQLNVTVINDDIQQQCNTSFFIAPKSTIVTMNNISNCDVDNNITVTGRLTDSDGKVLRFTSVGVLINGISYGDSIDNQTVYIKEYIRTNENGEYTYVYTPKTGGSLDICVYYPGYHYYRYNHTKSHIWVMPKTTKVSVNIENLTDDWISIYGRLTDVDDKPLKYTSAGMLFNGKNKTYVKTDFNGNYNITYKPVAGKNNIKVYYPGYHYYRFNETEVEFNITKAEPILTVDSVPDLFVGNDIIINGKVTDEEGNPIFDPNPNIGGGGGRVIEDLYDLPNDVVVTILSKEYTNLPYDCYAFDALDKDGSFGIWFDYYSYEIHESEISMPVVYTGNYNYNPCSQIIHFSYKARPN